MIITCISLAVIYWTPPLPLVFLLSSPRPLLNLEYSLLAIAMASICDHGRLQCVHMSSWPKALHPDTWDPHLLDVECRDYKESQKEAQEMIRKYCQPEPLSDNETEVDMEEAEDVMNRLPSPLQQTSCFWTPEYQARREARRRLWSPPLTPPFSGTSSHSLQLSQCPPSSQPLRQLSSRSHNRQRPSSPPTSAHIQLHLPSTISQNKVCKPKPISQLRRPTTRSMKPSSLLSLHLRRGHVQVTSTAGHAQSVTFEQCLKDGTCWYVTSHAVSPLFFAPSDAWVQGIYKGKY